ncbi:short-chain dehydrogenase [Vallitalea longa]|uniref:Short-chain dehydrogenase n=1 Tax=Vallitalea longa TaxID=2936439 RepID=A0A9W5Y8R9_9FIRM|nr:SDR family NAD(P)-dependent oxidoreductase [Vallitalea longa]GKX28932.1 short-chain dehydrogenase [Vallitalea longa]
MKKIAVITGASSGFGREFVKQICMSKGYNFDEIWIIARRKERLTNLASKFPKQIFKILDLDLADEKCLQKYKNILQQEKPNVKLLINNAGLGKVGCFDKIALDDNMNMIDVNIKALTYITHVTLKYMRKSSRIIHIASSAAFLPQPKFAVYAATKSYVLSFSRALERELNDRGIYVTAVCPGPVETEFFKVASNNETPKSFKRFFFEPANLVVSKALYDSRRGNHISIQGKSMKGLQILSKVIPHSFLLKFIK